MEKENRMLNYKSVYNPNILLILLRYCTTHVILTHSRVNKIQEMRNACFTTTIHICRKA